MEYPIKHPCKPLATALAALLAIPLLAAPRPLSWRADFPSARVENFPVRHGTDVDFRPTWYVNGSPADTNGWTYTLSVQTNGAPAGEWATIPGTVFSHTNDCGAEAYNVLVRAVDRDGTVDYSAAARLRMLPSPGFEPGALPPMANFQESDPVFSAWLSTFEIPEKSLEPATNYTDRALGAFAETGTVERARSYGTPTRWTDATGCVWEVSAAPGTGYADWICSGVPDGYEIFGVEPSPNREGEWRLDLYDGDIHGFFTFGGPAAACLVFDVLGAMVEARPKFTVTNLVGRVAMTSDIPHAVSNVVTKSYVEGLGIESGIQEEADPVWSSEKSNYATKTELGTVEGKADAAALDASSALRIVLGESVWFVITNFMRTAQGVIPSLQLWEVRDGATNLVYDSREEITSTVRALTTELRTELESRIPSKAWGNYQSDGADNPQPGEVAIINQPTVILTGGGTFNKYLTVGDSSVWVLKSSGPVSFGGNTNGNFFAVLDDEGNTHFKVAKTDSYDLPMFVSDILPRQSQNHIFVYTATTNRQGNAVPQPVLLAADDLDESAWYEEAEGKIDALRLTVSWAKDETIPAWVATITPDVWHEKMFFRAKVTQEGGVAVINTAPVRFDGGIQIGNGTHRLVPYTTGGKTYLTLEAAP